MTVHAAPMPGVAIVAEADGIARIAANDTAALIWLRDRPAPFRDWIEGLDPAQLPRARMLVRPEGARAAVTAACDAALTPDGPERRWLIDDIAECARVFGATMGTAWLRLRLDVIATDACRRFHADRVTARLVCTYRGTGTQYGLADGDEPQHVATVPAGSPFVMRGTLWPPLPDRGLRHRSPSIQGSGETRLLLVLDPVTDPEAEG
ncbi:DUF1826 domain-containing protein [Paracoccus sp. PARArs4]|uniref:DUF1826 domain-containing protein n=1 Tax=Paracoccus sp. PARArs4 TaxID=2853442 RepID=UPI0024A67E9A|nr:DUF1826 domain-containing protein [Paracoccus sp. PARArs4]